MEGMQTGLWRARDTAGLKHPERCGFIQGTVWTMSLIEGRLLNYSLTYRGRAVLWMQRKGGTEDRYIHNVGKEELTPPGVCLPSCDVTRTMPGVMLMLPVTCSPPLAISLLFFLRKVPAWIKIHYFLELSAVFLKPLCVTWSHDPQYYC